MRITILAVALALIAGCNQGGKTEKTETKETMDQNDFSAADWVHQTNVYEVNLRQYTREGSFNAFSEELPRLKEMGVETLWFMPVTPIAQKNKKGSMGSYYACSDYTSINPEFGTMEDFKTLVNKAHSMGMKVIIDWVANHTGWDHVWTKSHPEYFEKDSATNDFKIASGMDDIIELDFKNPALRRAMIDAMKFWITETGIDGYRCDLAFWVELDFWKEARAELEKTKKIFWLGEFDAIEKPEYLEVFDAAYTWTWMHKTKEYYEKKHEFRLLDSILRAYQAAGGKEKMKLWFTTNHDENSWNGTEYEKYGSMAKALAVFSATWDGIPLIYSGQELPNKKRLQFFEKDTIEWTGKYELHDFYKSMLELRKNNKALRTGDTAASCELIGGAGESLLAYKRKNGNNEVVVFLNFSGNSVNANYKVDNSYTSINKEQNNLEIEPWGYRVFFK